MESFRQVPELLLFEQLSAITKSAYNTRLEKRTYRLALLAATLPTATSPTARFAHLSMTWKTPLCGASQSRTSSTISPVSHSPQGQPGYRSKAIVQTSREFTPTLNKALILQRNLPMFMMSSIILTILPLLKTEFSWLNAVNLLFQLLSPSPYPCPWYTVY